MALEPKFSMLEYVALDLPFDHELEAFKRGGAAGVGVTEFTGPKGRDVAAMKDALAAHDMAVTVCWPEVPSILPLTGFGGECDPSVRTALLCACIRRLSALGPVGVACLTGAQGDYSSQQARRLVVDGLRQAADVAGECGVSLGIEPIHPSIMGGLSLVTSITDTLELIEECGRPNIGVMFDMWHLWDSPDLLAEIRANVDRFLLVHVCDWREPPRSWADRALPGEGIADVPAILGALDSAGYDGWYELEVISDNGYWGNAFPDSLWNYPPDELVARGRDAFMRCWNEREVRS